MTLPSGDITTDIVIPTMMVSNVDGQTLMGLEGQETVISAATDEDIVGHPGALSSFSSVGPAYDGRTKPDILATGEALISARSHGTNQPDPVCEPTKDVFVLYGTSMATPIVASSVILIRQYFVDGFYPTGSKVCSQLLKY
jgi:hypothetical protein